MDILVNEAAPEPRNNDLIILWGMMGAGKSSKGRLIANSLGWNFKDLDVLIAKREKLSITDIFTQKGASYFRSAERQALLEVLEHETKPLVLAVGGGTPSQDELCELMLKSGWCVYFNVPVKMLAHRLMQGKAKRPLLSDVHTMEEMQERLEDLIKARKSAYHSAHIILEAQSLDVKRAAHELRQVIPK